MRGVTIFPRRTIRILLALISTQLLSVRISEACQCEPVEGTLEEAVTTASDRASDIFLGEITSTELVDVTDAGGHIVTIRRVTFRVLRSWKGAAESSLTVDMAEGGSECGPTEVDEDGRERDPMDGDQFLVYARAKSQSTLLWTSRCSRTEALCSGSGLDDIKVFEQLGIQPLVSDGLTVQELQATCGFFEQPSNEEGTCGIGLLSLVLLLAIGLLRGTHPHVGGIGSKETKGPEDAVPTGRRE